MSRPEIKKFTEFYGSVLGKVFCRLLRAEIRKIWPDIFAGSPIKQTIAGIGFATPYLQIFLPRMERVIAIMPGGMGAIKWPRDLSLTAAADETSLPLPDNSLDRIILVHALEYCENMPGMLREIWRVLAPGGKVLIILPNRLSPWAHIAKTPLGSGQPFSRAQIAALLNHSMFQVLRTKCAVHIPPVSARPILKNHRLLDKIAHFFYPALGAVVWAEAEKRVYAVRGNPKCEKAKLLVPIPQGILSPG